MTDVQPPSDTKSTEGVSQSTYDLLQSRLEAAAGELASRAEELNQQRLEVFGSSQFKLLGTERVKSESNAVPRDVINVGTELILAYNAVTGISDQVRVEDVFAVHHLDLDGSGSVPSPGQIRLNPNAESLSGSVLDDDQFRRDFDELHTYFKKTQLQQVYRTGNRLLAVFRTGSDSGDLRVLRWEISPDGRLGYLDARGHRDHRFPPAQDVEWIVSTRDDHIDSSNIRLDERVLLNPLGGSFEIRLDDGGVGSLLLNDPLQHTDQSLQDCQIGWARSGDLVLIDLLPYGENEHRYYVVNLLVHSAVRLDSLGQAFRQLPDNQGLIFPEGIYLKTGEIRTFDLDVTNMEMLEVVRSPNGEDVLYVFYEQASGRSILLSYNVVRQEVATPIWCHGHTIFDDGTLVIFREEPEPTRIHPIQIWITPFCTTEYADAQPRQDSALDLVGNPGLVSGIADALSLSRLVADVQPSSAVYADLLTSAGRFIDTHHWCNNPEIGDLAGPAHDIRMVAEQVLDEFERMQELQAGAASALADAEADLLKVVDDFSLSPPTETAAFIAGLATFRTQIGHLHSVRERREIDQDRVEELIKQAEAAHDQLAQDAAQYLATDGAFDSYHVELTRIAEESSSLESSIEASRSLAEIDELSDSMNLVAGTVGDLVVDDPRIRTSVLSQVSGVLAQINRARSMVEGQNDQLIETETGAAFATELGLLAQSIATAIGRASTIEACDEALASLMLHLERLETSGPRTEDQLDKLADRRDQINESLSARRQLLVDNQQQKAERLVTAANRTLSRVADRAKDLASADDVNGFFAADPMIARVRGILEDLRELGEPVRADELQARLGSARDSAIRSLRDRADLFEGDAVKLGHHRFSVDNRKRELTVVPTADHLDAVLTGTDLRVELSSGNSDSLVVLNNRSMWDRPLVSETDDLYRAAFLAGDLVLSAMTNTGFLMGAPETLLSRVQSEVDLRLDEGYDRGVHDLDAARILEVIGPIAHKADVLTTPAPTRIAAQMAWALNLTNQDRQRWVDRGVAGANLVAGGAALGSDLLRSDLLRSETLQQLETQLAEDLDCDLPVARYLISELFRPDGFSFGHSEATKNWLDTLENDSEASRLIEQLHGDLTGAKVLLEDYVSQLLAAAAPEPGSKSRRVPELVAALLLPDLPRRTINCSLTFQVDGLLGRHQSIQAGTLSGRVDDLLLMVEQHLTRDAPAHREYTAVRRGALDELKTSLRLDDLEPQVPEGFVRNQLIDQVYLPLIGDNLARQIGTIDDQTGARSGLLMLLSPPGYGKTTLVEYLADRIGMALVKVSGPGLGHDVTSLDPAQAPSATAAREIERINLAFAIGTNVILYLDDIQHTNPEFLQRFISLCDGQRRIEGVWNGEATTFDLRGKRFAVVMAGNPYTESGERFRIPDMLANRADTYNLGDVSEGNEVAFARSYLENALTSNGALAPLSNASPIDLNRFLAAANGEFLDSSELEGSFSSAEVNEITATLVHLRHLQTVVLNVNRQYISSAATDDQYRTEPPFLLQGSYRNMARMASKLLPIMTTEEVELLISEHYNAESQALTGAAEWNLLKLAELRGTISEEQASRRDDILNTFNRKQRLGGDERDPATRVVAAIEMVADAFAGQSTTAPEIKVTVEAPEINPTPIQVLVTSPEVNQHIPLSVEQPNRDLPEDWVSPPMPPEKPSGEEA